MPDSYPPLFTSLEELLDPARLAAWLGFAPGTWQAIRQPLTGGLSGATLERITLTNGDVYRNTPALILKRIDPATNWLMRASGDTYCREIRFTQSPLWQRLPEKIYVPDLAGALLPDGTGELLMLDLAPDVLDASLCYGPADDTLVSNILDYLAALHAACWQAPELHDSSWLASPSEALLTLTPEQLYHAVANEDPELDTYGMQATRMWPFLWRFIDPDDAPALWQTLKDTTRYAAAVATAPLTLAHGDTWIANLGYRDDRLILLDWSLTTAGPATFDSLWLAHTWHALDPARVLTEHRGALLRHGITAVRDDATWDMLVDLGWVRTFFLGAEWLVRDVRGAQSEEEEAASLARLRFWSSRTAEILRQRGW